MNFDLEKYLEDKDIRYWTTGKNVTVGWINIQCVFCSDPSNHLGLSPPDHNHPNGGYNCWRCGASGSLIDLIKDEIEGGITKEQVLRILLPYSEELPLESLKQRNTGKILKLPPGEEPKWMTIHLAYLLKRNFNNSAIEKYDLRPYHLGEFGYRILAPIYQSNTLVNYTSRDVTGKQVKYKHCSNENAIIPIKNCLYNIDTVKDKCIIVEGITDVWRIGDGCVCTFGIEFSEAQVNLLLKKKVKKATIIFDSEILAVKKAYELSEWLNGLKIKSNVIELDYGDPADFTVEEIKRLRKEIF